MEKIQVDSKWKWLEQKEFPHLPKLEKNELESITLLCIKKKQLVGCIHF